MCVAHGLYVVVVYECVVALGLRNDLYLRVTLGKLLPHARGLGFKPRRGGFPSGAKKEWGLSPKAKVRVLHTAQLDVTKIDLSHASTVINKDYIISDVLSSILLTVLGLMNVLILLKYHGGMSNLSIYWVFIEESERRVKDSKAPSGPEETMIAAAKHFSEESERRVKDSKAPSGPEETMIAAAKHFSGAHKSEWEEKAKVNGIVVI
nr:hypothetical protein [Tanacetum cinerariifolium]